MQGELEIQGLDTAQGLALFGFDTELYLSVLRSYVENTPAIIDNLSYVTQDTLPDYAIKVHGLKGSSASIGAQKVYQKAAALECMAKSGDLPGVLDGNTACLEDAEQLVKDIQTWLNENVD